MCRTTQENWGLSSRFLMKIHSLIGIFPIGMPVVSISISSAFKPISVEPGWFINCINRRSN